MPTIVVPVGPPHPGLALPGLAATSPLSEAEAARLSEASARDALAAADAAGGDLIVTYPPADRLPDDYDGEAPEAVARAVAAPALADPAAARFEVQVGSTPSARLGNVVTHLLRETAATSVGYLWPTAYHTPRTVIDGAAMKSRSSGVVLGPAPDGRVHYAAFGEAVDFTDALEPPALDTLAACAADADVDADFVEHRPVLERGSDLPTLLATVSARRRAGRAVPEHVAAVVDDIGLTPASEGDEMSVVRE